MITTVGPRLYSPNQVTRLGVAVAPLLRARASVLGASLIGHHAGLGLTTSYSVPYHQVMSPRTFSTTNVARLKDFFPAKETAYIRQTKPTWEHPGYSEEDMLAVVPGHRKPVTVGDWLAWKFVRFARWGMDLCTGLTPEQQVDMKNPTTSIVANKPLTEAQWLVRLIFLESIAGVPGMVAGMLRHFRSMRLLRRDNGWIESLLEESYNERMHLLTFLKMCEPGWFMKSFLILSQAVYFGLLSTSYLVSPKTTHRFVGYIEEEAVHTYTRLLHEIKSGQLTKWSDPSFEAPEIAVSYWKLPEGKRSMYDLILYIRADEAGHRGVNHTLGNLNQDEDPNPFVSEYKADSPMQKPSALLKPEGYERVEVIG